MKSTKSDLDLKLEPIHRLSNIDFKKYNFSLSDEDDMKYLWAGYKTGSFLALGDDFKESLTKEEFQENLETFVGANNLTPISFFSEDKIIGMGFFWTRGRIMETGHLLWFSWATPQDILECYISFVNYTRKQIHDSTNQTFVVIEFAQEKDKMFFDVICKYGIMRRVGTSLEIYKGEKACIYESRSYLNGVG